MTATMWESVAPGWADNADYVDTRAARVTERLLELTRPGPDDRVLELACGAGGTGLAAARTAGAVVVSDVAPGMTAIARARADARGVANVEARTLDFERIDEPDGSFDVVLCREGLMFAAEPARAAGEIARVLRPGARVAVAVWGPRERNPWLGIVLDAVGAQVGMPMPPAGVPGPFSLSDAAELRGLLARAPLAGVEVEELAVPLEAPSLDEWWSRTTALAGPLAQLLRTLPEEAIRARAGADAARYLTPEGPRFPGVTLIGSGRAG
jgi:SAM-dependent methyltransferase